MLRARVSEFDTQAEDDWEQAIGMSPELDFVHDEAQAFPEELFLPSLSPEPRSPSPSVGVAAHQRSPSLEITGYTSAVPVASMSPPPTRRPLASTDGHNQLATPDGLEQWSMSVNFESRNSGPLFGEPTARIVADTATAAAQALFGLLVHVLQKPEGLDKAFEVPAGVSRCEPNVMVRSFAQLQCDLRV